MGGLVARYAIGRLYRPPQREIAEDTSCDENSRGTICGLEAMNFITVATPHLGSRGHKQVFFLCFYLSASVLNFISTLRLYVLSFFIYI